MEHEPRCGRCGAVSDSYIAVDGDSGVPLCPTCFIQQVDSDPDVRFFLATIDRQIPETERLVRTDFHHTVPEWVAAIKSLTRIKDMQSFADGCTRWHTGPAISQEEAAIITLENIGCVMNELGWWKRLKWWWATGVTRSQQYHC